MDIKSCLNCKYEPDWSEPSSSREYPVRTGKCKYQYDFSQLPEVCRITISRVQRYSDDSGVMWNCKAWELNEDAKE